MRSLDHPSIIRIHEVFKTEFTLFIVMEFCTGGELFDELERCEGMRMPEGDVREHCGNILRALAYLHRNGIVHRDLKLENFIFTSKNPDTRELKMIDFGCAPPTPPHPTPAYSDDEFMRWPTALFRSARRGVGVPAPAAAR